MKILHVFNRHRGGGGADNAWDATIALSRRRGLDIAIFERDSRDLSSRMAGKLSAFANGLDTPAALRAFAARLEQDRPDVVHSHELYPLLTAWLFEVCTRAGIPIIHSCYDFRITCPIATHHDGRASARVASIMARIVRCCATAATVYRKAPPSRCAMRWRAGATSTVVMSAASSS